MIYPFIIVALILCGIFIRSSFHRGFSKGRESIIQTRIFNAQEECDRFRKLVIKLSELNILHPDEHYKVVNDSVFLNIRDIYPSYKSYYPLYFPTDIYPAYEVLIELLSEDLGYSGGPVNHYFEKAAYRPSIELKRFVNDLQPTA